MDDMEYGVPLKVTLKAGAGFEAPWLTIEADSAEELSALLTTVQETDVLERVTQASRAFRSRFVAQAASPKAPGVKYDPGGVPEDPITEELNAATTLEQLRAAYAKHKPDGWTDTHTKLATARKTVLEARK